ncbi:hypothetical protein HCN44_011313 [Aphidius gifuensis]|uniref:28S ribosomal protein S28, mitochondrial n=1 Tax=Aphidius gifuensis TaxID=684658 RepID=A0A834XZH3_APHGI|nr:28S ribosomal protein S28, mitochondrial [Aphidius gifuensis]KAF7994044.1 hypothetical protein HCN44_011313 [Aphidius gifuensis]
MFIRSLKCIVDPVCLRRGMSVTTSNIIRNLCSKIDGDNEKNINLEKQDDKDDKIGSFAKAFEKFNQPEPIKQTEAPQTFAKLLRNSKLINLGDPEGKVITGKIFHIVGDDLYIDFDWKFHCVCARPLKNSQDYVRGATVRLRIKDLELSTKFLGASKDLTILEADCTLLGLIDTPRRPRPNA